MLASSAQSTRAFSTSVARTPRQSRKAIVTCAADGGKQLAAPFEAVKKAAVAVAAAALLVGAPMVAPLPAPLGPLAAQASLTAGDPVKNASALLRYALPIDNQPIRRVQAELESISETLRVPGTKALGRVAKSVRAASSVLERDSASIVGAFAPDKKAAGLAALDSLKQSLVALQAEVDGQKKARIFDQQQEALSHLTVIEEAMVKGFPFQVPSEYSNLPQLKGRATVEMKIKFATPREDNSTGGLMTIVADGYNAPVSAGNFVDLVKRGFYDGMDIQRADGFVVQTGKPANAEGFVLSDGSVRRIPFEVMVRGDKVPVYEETLQDNGRYNEIPVLPFNAYGTMALARSEFESNDASSQFFWLLKESELTPTGSNLLDGRYAVFGYATEGAPLLAEMQVGDKIEYAKIVSGAENLVEPK